MSFTAAIGILLVVLGCALKEFQTEKGPWWVLFVLFFYVLAPIPALITRRLAGDFSSFSGNANLVAEIALFFTAGIVVSAFVEICPSEGSISFYDSMMELHKRRKALTEPEARYYMKQIVEGCCYLHDANIIHRDLKLGNLFLDDEMDIKIGDFGLAAKYEGERKKTLCGTPNYIAPEVLSKKGHGYEVDVWSLGCILYTLLVGKPPFETCSLKETYMRIKKNEYYIPSKVCHSAQMLIIKMLRPDPSARPRVHEIMDDPFFQGYCPSKLPISSLTMAPRFTDMPTTGGMPSRKPLSEFNGRPSEGLLRSIPEGKKTDPLNNVSHAVCVKDGIGHDVAEDPGMETDNAEPDDCYLGQLRVMLEKCLESKPADRIVIQMDEAEDPASTPVFWISKWVDYSDKYGLGYQLNNGSVGVLFNDTTRLLMNEDGETLHYIDRDGCEHFHTIKSHPSSLEKKKTLLAYFTDYMNENLLKAGANVTPPKGCELSRLPFLRTWIRTRCAIVLHLSCGIIQINFFQDHTKIIVCPIMGAVTYIDEEKNFRTFKLSAIEQYGCSKGLASRLKYARTMVERLQSSKCGGHGRC
eukprot:Seg422.4 transcript_id=Seg422.4/GoldUCD/mRNA.D3Y31 product="Serine/threonine-protein kinase PLK1" protein_id=Seg422.4/GoldUCD/D3Y31